MHTTREMKARPIRRLSEVCADRERQDSFSPVAIIRFSIMGGPLFLAYKLRDVFHVSKGVRREIGTSERKEIEEGLCRRGLVCLEHTLRLCAQSVTDLKLSKETKSAALPRMVEANPICEKC